MTKTVVVVLVLLLAGALAVWRGLAVVDGIERIGREGVFAVGRVVAVNDGEVQVEYRMGRQAWSGTAYPDRGRFDVGDVVPISALRDRPERVVIGGTEETPPLSYVPWFATGGALILMGIATAALSFAGRPASGAYPRVRWIGERHGA